MIKFIDSFKNYSTFEDEIILRCTCGCEVLSIGFAKLKEHLKGTKGFTATKKVLDTQIPDTETLCLSFLSLPTNKMSKKNAHAYVMMFPSNEAIILFYHLLKGDVNNGSGGIQSVNGSILVINKVQTSDGENDGVEIMGFDSSKKFIKYEAANSDKVLEKYITWELYLGQSEYEAFIKCFEKMLIKRFPDLNKQEEENEVSDNK